MSLQANRPVERTESRMESEKYSKMSGEISGEKSSEKNRGMVSKRNGEISSRKPVVFAISGYKNSGKTTLTVKLVKRLSEQGYRVATIKHDGHDFEPDVPGTDSYRHRHAGACGCGIFSSNRWMVIREQPEEDKIDEHTLIDMFPDVDVILLEGFKNSSWPKYFCRYPEEIPDEEKACSEILALLE